MRTKLLADRAAGNDEAFQKFLAERREIDGEKKNGFFSNMGKFVAKRWKELVSTVPYDTIRTCARVYVTIAISFMRWMVSDCVLSLLDSR